MFNEPYTISGKYVRNASELPVWIQSILDTPFVIRGKLPRYKIVTNPLYHPCVYQTLFEVANRD